MSDGDQTASDRDQIASDRDHESSDQDQVASDDDLAAGGDRATHDRSEQRRKESKQSRTASTILREEGAAVKLANAAERDRLAEARDQAAADRDAEAFLHTPHEGAAADALLRSESDRNRAAADRAAAAHDRAVAAADREEAARERAVADQARSESVDALRLATTDELTGAWTRRFGLEELTRELVRTQRTGSTLTLAFVDVNGLKEVNDGEGHLAGDALLHLTGATIRAHIRPYDLVVRYGGDEFVCGLPEIGASRAATRLHEIATSLAAYDPRHSISFGLAEATPTDDLETLIARADTDLLNHRPSGNSR